MRLGMEVGRERERVGTGGGGRGRDRGLSGSDMDFIETAVEVVTQVCGSLRLLGSRSRSSSRGVSLASLCPRWLERVWAEAEASSGGGCGSGSVGAKEGSRAGLSPSSITTGITSPPHLLLLSDSGSGSNSVSSSACSRNMSRGSMPWQQEVQLACAWLVVQGGGGGAQLLPVPVAANHQFPPPPSPTATNTPPNHHHHHRHHNHNNRTSTSTEHAAPVAIAACRPAASEGLIPCELYAATFQKLLRRNL